MLCCTDSVRPSWPPLLLATALLLWPGTGVTAPVKPPPAGATGTATTSPAPQPTEDLDWAAMARGLGKMETRTTTLDELRTVQPFPAAAWVALLDHADLAVRLGALEVLEDLAGSDQGYDPWQTDPAERAESLQRWRTWAATGAGKGTNVAAAANLQPEQLQDYLQDILGGDATKVERAMSRLHPYAPQAIGAIENFLTSQKSLQEGARGRLKEAQYRLLLESSAVPDAPRLARMLIFGNRDERVEGMEGISGAGKRVLPIVREMLNDREALVRERAVDLLFQTNHKPALAIIETHLKTEKDANVIHAAIRGFGKVESAISTRLLVGFLNHENEDLVSAALLSLSLQSGAARNAKAQIVACLKHPSWRVRAAALQCATKASLGNLGDDAINLLKDSDSFVRQAAVIAIAASARESGSDSFGSSGLLGMVRKATGGDKRDATTALSEAFAADDELKGVVLKAFATMQKPVPDKILEQFPKLSPELLAFGLTSVNPRGDKEMELLLRYGRDPNPDIACAALRVLAKYGNDSATVQPLLIEVLSGTDRARQEAVLDQLNTPYKALTAPRQVLEKRLKEITADVILPVAPPTSSTAPGTTGATATSAPAPAVALDAVSRLHAAFTGSDASNSSPETAPTTSAPAPASPAPGPGQENLVDRLHAAFLGAGSDTATTAPAQAPANTPVPAPAPPPGAEATAPGPEASATPSGPPKSTTEAMDRLAASADKPSGETPDLPLMAAYKLVEGGSGKGAAHFLRWWPHLNVQHRAALADLLSRNPQPGSLDIWQRLLRDPSREIRRKAVASAFYEEKVPVPIKLVFLELMRRDAVLEAGDVYQSRLESMVSDRESRGMISEQARLLVNDSRVDRQVLAAIMLRERTKAADTELLERATSSPHFWVRRAAVRSLGQGGKRTLEARLPTLTKDPSAWVREATAVALSDGSWPWEHHLDDNTVLEDEGDSYFSDSSSTRNRLSEPGLAALRELTKDKEERVRLAAMSSLLVSREEVHLPTYLDLFDRAANRKELAKMLTNFVERNYTKLGKGLAPLLERMDWKHVNESQVEAIQRHFGSLGKDTLTEFTAYVAEAGKAGTLLANAGQPQFAPENSDAADESSSVDIEKAPVTVLFFHNPGCHECEKVRKELSSLGTQYTGLKVQEHNIREPEAVILYEALSQRFNVPPADRLKTPAVFLQSGVFITEQINRPTLASAIRDVAETGETDVWHQTQTQDLTLAKEEVQQRVHTLQPAVIFFAGLLDGVNPCAFATIIFLLSYLQVAKRTSREILLVGMSFICGVFITYFVLGLGLVEVVSRLTALQTIGTIVNWILALGCLVVAVLSWRDARLASQGRLQDMSLQLPGFLKERIRGVIRTGTRVNRFVIAAFGAGVVISVLELACTGQVYLPTIVYAMKSGASNATGFLLLYNLAFIVPLATVFGLAWGGLRSDALIRFQHRHTAKVKYALALLFGLLFVVLATSGRL
ncbi:cytochrome c biogenesis protein CcdA [Verrucomicrobium sp. BvORR106]|uniref:HEAT repeat domain-containing protein n=1 Tax=Verrucomicrobium sp. BvORR106 TaxID=1403819 RepID=UPI00056E702B|nr:cytochrome c biogenesis protein CcdA [Verrucomicrobium sp. BvORR106]